MKAYFFTAILAALLASGCARTVYVAVPAGATPEQKEAAVKAVEQSDKEKKVAKEIEKQIKTNEEWTKKQAQYKLRLGLSCPIGGYDGVEISSRLGNEANYLGPANSAKMMFGRPVYVLGATNAEDGQINILDTQGVVVSNMCPLGSITLIKSIPSFSPGYVRIFWRAIGINEREEIGQAESPSATLYNNNSWQMRQDANWIVRLTNQTGGFFSRKK